ncbi:hypothetical protein NADFUDRAFT_52324 [Nadsonia fulvescens var. elongata DSM 6958]|uniref:C2H2-type domain-containing protein n=1 Tax=Nadsonia fulvescens var. elongata DSM 6958 TaxID=857566 RepID=A0A1E3PIL4_9ASCO|nr:hypothetical protein NADFUDRAFT_52324 [Nadsonia fulvescens var. elongata DSM 6958]
MSYNNYRPLPAPTPYGRASPGRAGSPLGYGLGLAPNAWANSVSAAPWGGPSTLYAPAHTLPHSHPHPATSGYPSPLYPAPMTPYYGYSAPRQYPEVAASYSLPSPYYAAAAYAPALPSVESKPVLPPISAMLRLNETPTPSYTPAVDSGFSTRQPVPGLTPANPMTPPSATSRVATSPLVSPLESGPDSPSMMKSVPVHLPASPGPMAGGASPKKRYPCFCGRTFSTSGHLTRHARIHTGEKNHICPFDNCEARFSRHDNCMQHYRTHLTEAGAVRAKRRRTLKVIGESKTATVDEAPAKKTMRTE